MSCTHTNSCPLHPRLNASLAGWKTAYCDTEQAWLDCARYQASLSGKPVPLALLPNGKTLGIMIDEATREEVAKTVVADRGSSNVAVMTDKQAEVALEEAASSRRLFSRIRGLFGGFK